jgi:diguanylate cyclase (GGDEF)-like protein
MKFSALPLLGTRRPPDAVYVELVDALFSLVPPMIVFSVCLSVVGLAITARTGDVAVAALTIAGVLISSERLLLVRRYRRATAAEPLSAASARIWEKRFMIRGAATALIIGMMGARCFMLPDPSVHMLIIGLLVAYTAGIITRVAYRPRMAALNLLLVSVPSIIALLIHGGSVYFCLAFVMTIFLFGGFETVQHLYETFVSQLTLKLGYAGLARLDPLTGLSNRLVLNENLERMLAQAQRNDLGLAIHSLDLDHFKAANDRFGHPIGDALLREVARRLSQLTRASDLLVRLGGDEFILVQTDVSTREQALALASRILADVGATYRIEGHEIVLGTSIGIAMLTSEQLTADDLLARADQALYQAKRAGTGFAIHTFAPQLVPAIGDLDEAQSGKTNERKSQGLR